MPPAAPKVRKSYPHAYGVNLGVRLNPLELEQWCFRRRWPPERGGLGRYRHLRNAARYLWPGLEWNPWLERQIAALCDESTALVSGVTYVKAVAMTGCAAAGKTFAAALYASFWWRLAPHHSAVIFCSTTKEMLRRRVWAPVVSLHMDACDSGGYYDPVGRLIDSRTKIVAETGDDLHGMFGIAVAGGETTSAVQHIKGMHCERIAVVIDEAEATPEAIFQTLPNLRKGCREFIVIALGNSVSHLDAHGLCCQPAAGWTSVSIEDESWPTRGVSKWQIEPGICLHFDGRKSPNVLAGETLYPYLYSWEDHRAALARPDYAASMAYWSHDRGFWPPEGLADRLFTEQMIEKYNGMGRFEWRSRRTPLAFLDPAFGGDECKLVFGAMGDTPEGRLALEVTEAVTLNLRVDSKDELDYQVARRAIAECKKRGVNPRQFGCDAVGTGRGVHAIIAGEWSPEVQRVEATVMPTLRPSSTADGRPAKEVYDRMATELWWSAREALQAGQLRGLYRDAVVQLCSRLYAMQGRKYRIETKAEFKLRLGRSPDDADCFVAGTQVLTPNGEVPIEQLREGDAVVTPMGVSRIERLHAREVKETVCVRFSSGAILEGKGKHRVFTREAGWVPLRELSLTHTMESAHNLWRWRLLNQLFTPVSATGFKAQVDITRALGARLRRRDFFIESSGKGIAGLCLAAASSITRTGIGKTIGCATSRLCRLASTLGTIASPTGPTIPLIALCASASWPRPENWLLTGIARTRAESGTGDMAGKWRERARRAFRSAQSAGSAISPSAPANPSPVPAPASIKGRGRSRSGGRLAALVLSAGRLLRSLRSIVLATVPVTVQRLPQPASRRVYNLTLEAHNAYYANGILVDNCIVGLVEVARRNGLDLATPVAVRADKDWERLLKAADAVHADGREARPQLAYEQAGFDDGEGIDLASLLADSADR